jgi:hypothetical protein
MDKIMKIPKSLRAVPQWVCWKIIIDKNGKVQKMPVNPNKKKVTPASVSDPSTWSTFKKAKEACQRLGLDGIGIVLTENDLLVGIDLDACRDPTTEKIEKWAREIIRDMESFSEVSPSGTGVHIYIKGKLPAGGHKGDEVEIYDRRRYLTVTGKHLKDTPMTIHRRDMQLKNLIDEYFPDKKTMISNTNQYKSNELSDKEIIKKAKEAKDGEKFKRLWAGNISEYSSHSEADLALCEKLCFYAGKNPEQIDRVFRQSKLLRKKWDKKHSSDGRTYGQMTIQKAMETTKSHYDPKYNKDILAEIVEGIELFHTSLNEPYATMRVKDHYETWPIRSTKFSHWIGYEFFKRTEQGPKTGELNNLLDILSAKALYAGPMYEIHTRIAEHDGEIYLDLANDNWEVVRITSESWEIIRKYSVKFRRSDGMFPLPHPDKNGNIGKLLSLLNIKDHATWVLTNSWLIGAMRPKGPYSILMLLGEQGSAKSTYSRILRSIIDPSKAPLRTIPRNERDLMISATNSFVIAIDNMSSISYWLSDALCRLSTGGGFSTRRLHTDAGEIIFNSMRPIILNGIDVFVYAHDLVDRCIILNLPKISKSERRTEEEIQEDFKKAHPAILGGLCDAVSEALKNLPSIQLKSYPRMADFARWVTAAESALPIPQGEFIRCYNNNRADSVQSSLDADPVSVGIRDLMELNKKWSGTATQLLKRLEGNPNDNYSNGIVPRNITKSKVWPKAPHILSRRLKKASSFLSTIGIELMFGRRDSKERMIRIIKTKQSN